MPDDQTLTIYFHRNDGRRERVRLTHGTISDAMTAIHTAFSVGDGLYTTADVYRGDELIETVANPDVRVESI